MMARYLSGKLPKKSKVERMVRTFRPLFILSLVTPSITANIFSSMARRVMRYSASFTLGTKTRISHSSLLEAIPPRSTSTCSKVTLLNSIAD